MRSRAAIKGHPVHPSLIPFPFAFLTGALLFDLLGVVAAQGAFHATASHLTAAGVMFGLIAAIPGVIDYVYTVPPKSSGKQRATTHASLNVGALVLFTAAWFQRGGDSTPSGFTLTLEAIGTGALVYAGWLGGTLMTRNMTGVDHRYAGAGKWQDESIPRGEDGAVVIGHTDDLADDQMKLVRVDGRRYVLARTNGSYAVFDDGCTHRGGSLAGGVLIGGVVQCLWHGSQFDVKSGQAVCGPAKKKIRTYDVKKQKDGRLTVELGSRK